MLTIYDYALCSVGLPAPVYATASLATHRQLVQYFALVFYLTSSCAATIGMLVIIHYFGFTSPAYSYSYSYSESVMAILLYFVALGFIRQLFEDLGAGLMVRIAGILLLAGTALISFLMAGGHKNYLTSRFVVELGRNLNFVGVVLVVLLWSAMMKAHETRARMFQLVLALGIYFSGFVPSYGLRMVHPEWIFLRSLPPLLSTGLSISWAYSFTKLPEEARLATARVTAFRIR